MNRPETAPEPSLPRDPIVAEWLSAVRAYLSEDWLTTGLADALEEKARAARAASLLTCLGCGRRLPRSDLWVHRKFGEVAYCDACYYPRFGRQPA